jgi:bifunctional DNA-binding transcriptional regulator/antitoxin component of YhaV-PrlF toxin-antitoxin module
MTSKGQVTVPKKIREETGILPDCEIEFKAVGEVVEMRKKPRSRGQSLVDHLRGTGTSGMTTDEIMQLTRGED